MSSAVRMGAIFAILVASSAHASQQPDLSAMEKMVAKQFNGLRKQAGLSQLKVRRDLRVRMEACSVQVKGPDPLVDIAQQRRKFWYLTADPEKPHEELARLAKEKTGDDHVAIGIWFARRGLSQYSKQ